MKFCSCFTAIASVGLLSVIALGCATPSEESSSASSQDVTGIPATGLCSDPSPTSDGEWLLLDVCPSGSQPGRLVLRKVDSVTTVELATYPTTSRIASITQNGHGYAAVLARPADGAYDVLAGDWTAPGPAFRLDVGSIAGASAATPKAIHVTANGKWLLGVSGDTSVAFAAELATGNVAAKDLRSGAKEHRFVSTGDRALLVSSRSEQNALGRTLTLSGSGAIGEPVELPGQAYAVVDETYDGQHVDVTSIQDDGSLSRIDLATGALQVLAKGDGSFNPIMQPRFGAAYAWFTNQSRSYDPLANSWHDVDTLQRVRADGSGAVEDYRAVSDSGIGFVAVTADQAHVLYKEGKLGFGEGTNIALQLGSLSAGSTPTTIATGSAFAALRVADRLAISYKSAATGDYETLVLDASGNVVGRLPGAQVTYNGVGQQRFSGDGKVFYLGPVKPDTLACSASGTDFRTCKSDGYGLDRTIAIPGASEVIVLKTRPSEGIHQPRDMQIVAP